MPDFVPAVSAGVRLLRAPRASVRDSFRGAALRDNVPVRPEELDFPATADPLPLCFAQDPTADFPLRDPFAEWPLLAAVRVVPGRASDVRRGCRAFPDGGAGLRLRA